MESTPLLVKRIAVLCTLLFAPILVVNIKAQELSSVEKFLLQSINRDSTTHTVAYLPESFSFGISHTQEHHFILVKSGKQNYFLMNGTNRVYLPDPVKPLVSLLRLDSTRYEGDNFLMTVFMRKDTIYQFGGYGFWKVKDNFSFYDSTKHEWQFLRGGSAHQATLSIYSYDPIADRLYFMEKMNHDEHKSSKTKIVDSMYCYDFATKNWTTLGEVLPELAKQFSLVVGGKTWFNRYGVGLVGIDKFFLVDLPNNKIFQTSAEFDTTFKRLFNGGKTIGNAFPIQLGDTVYFIFGEGNNYKISKYKFRLEDFRLIEPQMAYSPMPVPFILPSQTRKPILILFLFLATTVLIAARWWIFNRNGHLKMEPSFDAAPPVYPIQFIENASAEKFSQFLDLLTPIERELVGETAKATLNNELLDINRINKILGVSKKEISLQKNRRSTTISHINNLFQQFMQVESSLILREKDHLDKRVFRYYIDKSFLEMLNFPEDQK